jgi:hypothetical protein
VCNDGVQRRDDAADVRRQMIDAYAAGDDKTGDELRAKLARATGGVTTIDVARRARGAK